MATGTYTPGANDILHTVEVNFESRELIPTPVHVVQYDKKIPILEVVLYKGDAPYVVPSSATVNIRFRKPDGHIVNNPAIGLNANRTIVYFQVTYQMSSKDGDALAIVEVDLGNSGSGGSGAFRVIVERNPVQEGDIESTDEMLNIQGYVDQAKQYAEASKYAIQIGNTITGNPGTPARVVNRGTAQNAILEFTIPRGLDGSLDDPTALLGGDVWLLRGGIAIQSGDDLNDYTNVGNYYSPSNSNSQTLLNTPTGRAFTMKVFYGNGIGELSQFLKTYDTHDCYARTRISTNNWSNWVIVSQKLINNLTTPEPGKGSLDAYQGKVIKRTTYSYDSLALISTGSNLNDFIYLGDYCTGSLNVTNTLLNCPIKDEAITLRVRLESTNDNNTKWIVQEITGWYSRTKYERISKNSNATEFSDWEQVNVISVESNYKSLTQFTEIPSGADLKSAAYLVPGNYCCMSILISQSLINCPISTAFTLEVSAGNGKINEFVKQTFISYDGTVRAERVRNMSSGNWTVTYKYTPDTGLAYTDVDNINDITIPDVGYFSLASRVPSGKTLLFATVKYFQTLYGGCFNVYASGSTLYVFGNPGCKITKLGLRLWYRP